nr:acyl-CoA dehydrogenase family protein [Caldalkalibacillus thermarum]
MGAMETTGQRTGGEFLVSQVEADAVFTPEDLTEEQKMIVATAKDFVEGEVNPHSEEIENQDFELTVRLLRKAGELGLLAHSIPEAYGGLGLDKVTKGIVGEALGGSGSYGVAHSNHTCIATLPITYFGTEEQKRRYLPKLASGEYLGAYCLTEPSSGSDALGAKTTAVLNDAGTHYVLNGTKQWITNAGFADTFIVYAKVDGEKFTAFIVEKDFPGLSLGPEEKKMGIKESSTRSVILENCPVPVENVLGEVGRGHLIAFTVLNLGRYNLGFACTGGAKKALEVAVKYTKERYQFKRPLSAFTATQEKLANMAIRIYASESLQYRTGGLLEEALGDLYEETDQNKVIEGLSEFAIECAICKVFGSETLDQVVDEALQLHGGYGFMQEYAVEQMYRDARIQRIFEGTNEINRLIVPGFLLRRSKKGKLDLQGAIEQAVQELHQPQLPVEGPLAQEQEMILSLRRLFLVGAGLALQTLGDKLQEEQEVLMKFSELAINLYAAESAVLRAKKAGGQGLKAELARACAEDVLLESELIARRLVCALTTAERQALYIKLFQREIGKYRFEQTLQRKREIASRVLDAEKYVTE